MDEHASVADLRQGFLYNLVLVDDLISFVHKIDPSGNFTYETLVDGKVKSLKWDPKRILPPPGRLGYVNTGLGCAYVTRRPVRRWAIGLNSENVKVGSAAQFEMLMNVIHDLRRLRGDGFHYSAVGEYPSLEEAWSAAQSLESSFAFDRQFEVCYDRTVYYRGLDAVGKINPSTLEIEFKNPMYKSLLDGSHGKSFRRV